MNKNNCEYCDNPERYDLFPAKMVTRKRWRRIDAVYAENRIEILEPARSEEYEIELLLHEDRHPMVNRKGGVLCRSIEQKYPT